LDKYIKAYTLGELHEALSDLMITFPANTPIVQASRFADFTQGVELNLVNVVKSKKFELDFIESSSGDVVVNVSSGN
jgi:hypothetical protein